MPPVTFSQITSGLRGRVADSTGAIVPKASITVHNVATGVDRSTSSTDAGLFNVPFLTPGTYDVTVKAAGFETVTKTKLALVTDQVLSVDFTLMPGSVTETVTIDASTVQLDYEKSDRGDLLDNRRIQELPVNSDNVFTLATLSAGTMTGATYIGPLYDNQPAQNLSIHGAAVEFNIDGASDLSGVGAQNYAYSPPVAAVQEFKITTNAYDAAHGRSPGGAIDITLKSGTSRLHGTAYEFLQRSFLNSNSSTNKANIALRGYSPLYNKPAFTQDQYGLEFDGPVVVPYLIGPSAKTFFTILYENLSVRQLFSNNVSTIPTQDMIRGDFSSFLTANGARYNQPIYDPDSEAACTANNTDNGTYAQGKPKICRYQFGYGPGPAPGPQGNPVLIGRANVIPSNRLNPVAVNILSWYPTNPNQTPIPTTANNIASNNVYSPPGVSTNRTYLIKLDNNYRQNDSFSLALKLWTQFGEASGSFPRTNVNAAHPGLNFAASTAHFTKHYKNPGITLGWIHTFSPQVVNSLKASLLISSRSDTNGPASGFDPATLGLPSALGAASPTNLKRFPNITVNNFTGLGSAAGGQSVSNIVQVSDVVNITHGSHNMHFGGEFRPNQYSNKVPTGGGIALSFDKGFTQQWDTNVTGGATNISSAAGYSGNAIASMLLGTGSGGSATIPPSLFLTSKYYALYFQDDWKVTPKLTLNLGIRWETAGGGDTERHNQQVSRFDATSINPITGQVNFAALNAAGINISRLLGGITFAGVGGNSRSPFETVLWQFGPRVGFAYTTNQRTTVIRGGMGLYYADQGAGNAYAPSQLGYTSTTNYIGSNDGGATPLHNLSNPFPVLQPAVGNCGGDKSACLTTNAGQTLSYMNPNFHMPVVLMSSFGIEQQLTKWDTLELSYAGNQSYEMPYSYDINHISAAAQALCDPERGGQGNNCTSGASTGTGGYVSNPFKGLPAFTGTAYYTANTIQRYNFSRPFPQFTSITENNRNGGRSWYHALEATFNHRATAGLSLHATYTFSKGINATGFADVVNNIPSRTIFSTDVPHRITVSDVYLLPIQRGHGLFPNLNRYLDLFIGGWQTSTIFTYQSGLPSFISGFEIDREANGGYILPRKRFWPGQPDPYHSGSYTVPNSYVQAFKPCVGTRDPNTGVVTLQPFSVAAGCSKANFTQVISTFGVTPNIVYTGVRLQRYVNIDANLSKNFKAGDRASFQLRLDAFNVANHITQYSSNYNTSVSDSNFGTFQFGTSSAGNYPPRVVQISGRLTF